MIEASKHTTLAGETCSETLRREIAAQKFDRSVALKQPVAARSAPHFTHTTAADFRHERPRAEAAACGVDGFAVFDVVRQCFTQQCGERHAGCTGLRRGNQIDTAD